MTEPATPPAKASPLQSWIDYRKDMKTRRNGQPTPADHYIAEIEAGIAANAEQQREYLAELERAAAAAAQHQAAANDAAARLETALADLAELRRDNETIANAEAAARCMIDRLRSKLQVAEAGLARPKPCERCQARDRAKAKKAAAAEQPDVGPPHDVPALKREIATTRQLLAEAETKLLTAANATAEPGERGPFVLERSDDGRGRVWWNGAIIAGRPVSTRSAEAARVLLTKSEAAAHLTLGRTFAGWRFALAPAAGRHEASS